MRNVIGIFYLFVMQVSIGQNLITNGGFETFTLCPNNYGDLNRALGWVNPTGASPDYLNQCATLSSSLGVPTNEFGYQQAHGGDAYVGIGIFTDFPVNFREYIQTRLVSPLEAGACYRLEMFVSLGENYCKYTTDDWGAYFSASPVNSFSNLNLTFTPQILNAPGNFPDGANWKLFSGYFSATGGEEYITIGNFKSNVNTNTVSIQSTSIWDNIYMYIDDVSLTVCRDVKLSDQQRDVEGRVFPTFFSEKINASVDHRGDAELVIYNKSAQIISRVKFNSTCSIATELWDPGVYFYKLRSGTVVISQGKLMKE